MLSPSQKAELEKAVVEYDDDTLKQELKCMLMFGAPVTSKLVLYDEFKRRNLTWD